jgi:hypothetical protein
MGIKRVLKEFINLGYTINKNGSIFNPKGKLIKTCVSGNYLKVGLRILSYESYSLKIHKIQAYQKYGDAIFKKGIVVRHKDGNSLNNSWDNILIGTQSDNMMDIPKEQRILNASNPIHNHEDILKDRNAGLTYKELMEKYNISSKGTISFIINKSLIACKA